MKSIIYFYKIKKSKKINKIIKSIKKNNHNYQILVDLDGVELLKTYKIKGNKKLIKNKNSEKDLNNIKKMIECNGYKKNILIYQRETNNIHVLYGKNKKILIKDKYDYYFRKSLHIEPIKKYLKIKENLRSLPKSTKHCGQLKLFLSSLMFFNFHIPIEEFHEGITIVYIGSAQGHNTWLINNLIKNIHWILIDKNDHYYKLKELENVKIYNQYADEKLFKKIIKEDLPSRPKNLYMFSDIRTMNSEKDVNINNKLQFKLMQLLKAKKTMLKFKVPYIWKKKTYKYANGEIYLQAFPRSTGLETRLICEKPYKNKTYNKDKFIELISFHNKILRSCEYNLDLKELDLKLLYEKHKLCKCYDCSYLKLMVYSYIKKFRNDKQKQINKLISYILYELNYGDLNVTNKFNILYNI